eukprot:CAMPEP_0202868316 /NCGR_PEP_ID=MMETSP1391-20130828/10705_1 /ASSEMBLY_ACC=CAM_ASM_000867 /TAXON_ID=1034604 /ORGANISM="Chlamydomonas leiostraca, Strain SAG 11-49" /LENGTH=365 /DNA_ID=CAMNT_0049548465 /DNA_START=121 /DNA_END=1215 /DNA_ORIENTATION=+
MAELRVLATLALVACLALLNLPGVAAQQVEDAFKFEAIVKIYTGAEASSQSATFKTVFEFSNKPQEMVVNLTAAVRNKNRRMELRIVPSGDVPANFSRVTLPGSNETIKDKLYAVVFNKPCTSDEATLEGNYYALQLNTATGTPNLPATPSQGAVVWRANNNALKAYANKGQVLSIMFNFEPDNYDLTCPVVVSNTQFGWVLTMYDRNIRLVADPKFDRFEDVWAEGQDKRRSEYFALEETYLANKELDFGLISASATTKQNFVVRVYTTGCWLVGNETLDPNLPANHKDFQLVGNANDYTTRFDDANTMALFERAVAMAVLYRDPNYKVEKCAAPSPPPAAPVVSSLPPTPPLAVSPPTPPSSP